jgi:hypothetical protein
MQAMDISMGKPTSNSFNRPPKPLEQFTRGGGTTFLFVIVVVYTLFNGLTLVASQTTAIDCAKKEGKFVLYTAMQPED